MARGASKKRYSRNIRTGGFLDVEVKFYDTALTATAMSAATDATGGEYDPSVTSMISTPAQGDGEQNRDGKQIVAKYVQIKGTLNFPAQANLTTGVGPLRAMVAIVLDTQSNAAQAQSETVFKNLAATALNAPDALRNLEYSKRFKLLKQDLFILDPPPITYDGTNVESDGVTKSFDWYIPLNNLKINFNSGTTASIANVVDNSIHVMGFANNATITISYNARMRFVG